MIGRILVDILFSVARVALILFPLYLLFEGIGRRLNARTSARVGAGLGIGLADALKSLVKSSGANPGRELGWLDGFFVLSVALFSLVPWQAGAAPEEYELRLHLYLALVALFTGCQFLLFLREEGRGRATERFAAPEVFLFFLLLTPIALNEASFALLRQGDPNSTFHSFLTGVALLVQSFLGLLLFSFPSSSKDALENRLGRVRPPLFHFSRFVASMSWLCLHLSMVRADDRVTLGGFAAAFLLFVFFRQAVEGYARFDGKLARVLTWKYFFPVSLTLFLVLVLGGTRS